MPKTIKVIIPDNVEKLILLALSIFAKHLLDGGTSVLNGLNMTDMQNKANLAQTQHNLSEQKSRDAETATEARNNALGADDSYLEGFVMFFVTSIRDFLLGQFKGQEHKLGNWGFVVNDSPDKGVSVVIPDKVPELIDLAIKIFARHTSDGVNSILNPFDMTAFQAKTDLCFTQHNLAKTLEKEQTIATEARNLALGYGKHQDSSTPGTVLFYVVSARDMLLGLKRGKERELGYWGFEVREVSSTPIPTPTPTPTPADITITLTANINMPAGAVTFQLSSKNPAGGEPIVINWGDNSSSIETFAPGGTGVNIVHSYPIAGNYNIGITGSLATIGNFACLNSRISSILFPVGINPEKIFINNNLLTTVLLLASFTSLISFNASNNNLDANSIDGILAIFNGFNTSNGSLSLQGAGNAAPSPAGMVTKTALGGRGWTVTTN